MTDDPAITSPYTGARLDPLDPHGIVPDDPRDRRLLLRRKVAYLDLVPAPETSPGTSRTPSPGNDAA